MKKYNKYIGLLLLSLGFFSCDDNEIYPEIAGEDVAVVALNAEGLDFSKYISVGASFTAGFTDNALFIAAQENSFPNILASKFAMSGGGEFNLPLMNDNIGGMLVNGVQVQGPRLYFNGAGPVPLNAAPTTDAINSIAASGPYNNIGLPGAKSFHLGVNGYAGLNPYFGRIATSPTQSVIEYITTNHANATFFTLSEIGGNDVLGYALTGGDGSNLITPTATFDASFGAILNTLSSGSAKGVVANIPYITSLAHFTTVPYNAVPLDAATAGQLNTGFAAYNQGLQGLLNAFNANLLPANLMGYLTQVGFSQEEVDKRQVNYIEGQNPVLILDESLIDLSIVNSSLTNMRQATAEDLLVLTSSSFIGTTVGGNAQLINGVSVPLGDKWVLTPQEQEEIKTATDAYNTTIETMANANSNVALVDFKSILQQASTTGLVFDQYNMNTDLVFGGLISLDGVHLTSRGYAMMANEILKATDAAFGSNFEQATDGLAKADDYPTNYSPALR